MLAIPRGVVEHRLVGRHRVVHRLAEMPGLRRDRGEIVALGQLLRRHQRNLRRRRAADGLGEQADHVVELAGGAEAAVEPGRVRAPERTVAPGFPSDRNRCIIAAPTRVDAVDDQRVEVVVERVAERRA